MQVLEDMILHQRPVALLRLDTPATPQVELIVYDLCAARLECDACILATPRVIQPPVPTLFDLAPIGDPFVPVQIAEVLEAEESSDVSDMLAPPCLPHVSLECEHAHPPTILHDTILYI